MLKDKKITLLGLAFKPGTDDMLQATSIKLVRELLNRNVKDIIGYDPKAKDTAKKVFGNKIEYAESIDEELKDSDFALLITEWEEFEKLTPNDFKKYMKTPNLVDGKRIFNYKNFNESIPFRVIGRIG